MSEENNIQPKNKKSKLFILLAVFIIAGLAITTVVYFASKNDTDKKVEQNREEEKQLTPSPDVTSTPVPTSSPTSVTTPEPILTNNPEPTQTPVAGDPEENLISDYEYYSNFAKIPENYMNIPVEDVTQDELDDYIEMVRHDNIIENSVDREIQEGDIANIDYVGYLDGVAFEGGTDYGFDLEIGSGSFIEGFEEGLIGAKKGETKSLNLKFPEQYHSAELAGKEVVFEVKINDVIECIVPEFNDDFVKNLTAGMYTTTQEFILQSKAVLLEEKQYYAVMDYILENSSIEKINETYVEVNLDYAKSEYEMYAKMYGISLDEFIEAAGLGEADKFWEDLENEIRNVEKQCIALYGIAKEQKITLTEEEFNEAVINLASENGLTSEEFLQEYDREFIEQTILIERAMELLVDNTVVK